MTMKVKRFDKVVIKRHYATNDLHQIRMYCEKNIRAWWDCYKFLQRKDGTLWKSMCIDCLNDLKLHKASGGTNAMTVQNGMTFKEVLPIVKAELMKIEERESSKPRLRRTR